MGRMRSAWAALAMALLASASAARADLAPHAAMHVAGHGPVVVFESGMAEAQENWAPVARPLARCLTTVTYDRARTGDSASPVLASTVADDLLALLHAHDLRGPYILVGHSIGGLYVQAFARNHPQDVAGVVLADASSPLEPPGVFVSTVPPRPGSVAAAEEAGVAPSVAALQSGPPFPPVPLIVLAATDHHDTPDRESLWREVQRKTASLSPKGRLIVVQSGHFIQADKPDAVIGAVLTVAAEAGMNTASCRH